MSGLLLVLPFIAGLAAGALEWISAVGFPEQTQTLLIYALLFFIGVSVGSDEETLANLKTLNLLSLLVPFSILAGSLIGGAVGSVLINRIDVNEGMSIGAGLGYYSLSSVLIGQLRGEELGVIALMANIFREVSTILFAPLLVSLFGEMALIASGGATTSDTSLPVIQRYSGNRYTLIAVFNGIVLSLLVPLVVPLFL
ncbi:lysine exporter LysO family protein [Ornatilinea apprima]|uniref:lysine exporter LysO family protein n=1 Tax=Ornatilinea apprima TaxID=1134406 RepID=UPI0009462AA4|nr:lysine exporter LysO family protein [Ornatilinea apprima]